MKIRIMAVPTVAITALSAVWFAGCASDTSNTVSQTEGGPSDAPQTVAKKVTGDAMAHTVSIKEGFDVPAFDVYTVSGELKGDTLCYVWKNAFKPVTLVFARKPSPDLARLVKVIQTQTAQSQDKAAAFVVFLPDNAETAKPEIEKFAADNKITVPLTIPEKLDDVHSKFGIKASDAMPVQVLVYRDKKVQKPFALTQIKDTDVQAVQTAIKKSIT